METAILKNFGFPARGKFAPFILTQDWLSKQPAKFRVTNSKTTQLQALSTLYEYTALICLLLSTITTIFIKLTLSNIKTDWKHPNAPSISIGWCEEEVLDVSNMLTVTGYFKDVRDEFSIIQ